LQVLCASPTTGISEPAQASSTKVSNTRRVSFSALAEVVEYVVDDAPTVGSEDHIPSEEIEPPASAEPALHLQPARRKRGRPRNTPLQEFKKKVKLAERLYLHAEKDFEKYRDKLPMIRSPILGTLWACADSVKQRHIERIEKRIRKVAQLKAEWMALEAEYHDRRVDEVKLAAAEAQLALHQQLLAVMQERQSLENALRESLRVPREPGSSPGEERSG